LKEERYLKTIRIENPSPPALPERAQARDQSASAAPRDAGRVAGVERAMKGF